MSKIKLTLACGDYDRTRPLWDGTVSAEGLDLNVLLLPVEEIFLRMFRFLEFDASELSMSTFLITKSLGNPRFMAIPVFPSRRFRHADIYIRKDSGINKPQDLKGGKIGLPEYQIIPAVWVRGILHEFLVCRLPMYAVVQRMRSLLPYKITKRHRDTDIPSRSVAMKGNHGKRARPFPAQISIS